MPDAAGMLWISQAESDLYAAKRLYDPDDHRTLCQTIAKYQQVVEKAIKAIAAAVRDAGIVVLAGMYKHDVEKMISALQHLPKPKDNLSIQGRINRLLDGFWVNEIKSLSALAEAAWRAYSSARS